MTRRRGEGGGVARYISDVTNGRVGIWRTRSDTLLVYGDHAVNFSFFMCGSETDGRWALNLLLFPKQGSQDVIGNVCIPVPLKSVR